MISLILDIQEMIATIIISFKILSLYRNVHRMCSLSLKKISVYACACVCGLSMYFLFKEDI